MASQWTVTDPVYSSLPGVDPAIDWAMGPGMRYFFVESDQQEWMPVVVHLNNIDAGKFADGALFFPDPMERKAWTQAVRVPSFFIEPPKGLEKSEFCTAMVTKRFFDALLNNPTLRKFVLRLELSLPLRADSLP